uniref:Sec-independent protein translocase component TatC n=1 Tax=Anotrichium furcellatum TaxID=41999 RepID=A0A4D6WK72_9FLOR|nr:Sec-independent protein translocase component TatC [Anotrichium furcellatum]
MKKIWQTNQKLEMSIIEHLEELRERLISSIIILFIITVVCILYTKQIAYILQQPATGIKFLQLAPGEYLFASFKMSISLGVILSSPFSVYQIILFILPGMTKQEIKYIIPILVCSVILFFAGIIICFISLLPIALNFLKSYGADIVEPIWSFDEYFNFVTIILFSTGITFQIPILQILLGISNICSSNTMLASWKYIIFAGTIIGAIITPSTDPITQIFMASIIIALYFSGIIVLKLLNK